MNSFLTEIVTCDQCIYGDTCTSRNEPCERFKSTKLYKNMTTECKSNCREVTFDTTSQRTT